MIESWGRLLAVAGFAVAFGALQAGEAAATTVAGPLKLAKVARHKAHHGKKPAAAKPASGPSLVGSYGDWNAYIGVEGKNKTCYALSQPKKRLPDGLQRDPAYIFITTQPKLNIRDDVSIVEGFHMRNGTTATADFGSTSFQFVGTETTLWLKNPAQRAALLADLRNKHQLVVAAKSIKGHVTTDTYSLSGLRQALEQVAKTCR
ncbi:MAG: hypothetical protein KGQ37_02430 [Hyphomicrobiales bacterium]|nr:hypothetical protein [Hyphomicrobiales bacterium]